MNTNYNPWERLMKSRKFWIMCMDAAVSLVLLLAARLSPEASEDIKAVIMILQPIAITVIGCITAEDVVQTWAAAAGGANVGPTNHPTQQ